MSVFEFRCCLPNLNFMLFHEFCHLFFELAVIVVLICLGISERTKFVNVGNHGGYVCSLLCSLLVANQTDASHWESSLHNEVC